MRQPVVLLPLHPPVLEPDFDLALGERQLVRDLDAPAPRQVAVVVELLLQLERLVARVGRSRPFAVDAVRSVCTHDDAMHAIVDRRVCYTTV